MKHGAEQVQIWRRFDIPPPALEKEPIGVQLGGSLVGKVIRCSMVDPGEYVDIWMNYG